MNKLPYSYVSKHVDKMYEKPIDINDLETVSKHCEFIQEFIIACGWEMDDYIRTMMGYEEERTLN